MILILAGATTAILGRHSVLGIFIGCVLMFIGWLNLERKEGKG